MSVARGWPPSAHSQRRRRRRALVCWTVRLVAGAVVFAVGLALGQSLDDNPDPATTPSRTLIRTLGPLPLSAPPTVTVTVTQP